jgi:hypothetical protein
MDIFITLLENVNKSRTSVGSLSLKSARLEHLLSSLDGDNSSTDSQIRHVPWVSSLKKVYDVFSNLVERRKTINTCVMTIDFRFVEKPL